ncbi:hypothetical protein VTO42DRAFT_5357 [Malbranchea cinnamomea]
MARLRLNLQRSSAIMTSDSFIKSYAWKCSGDQEEVMNGNEDSGRNKGAKRKEQTKSTGEFFFFYLTLLCHYFFVLWFFILQLRAYVYCSV